MRGNLGRLDLRGPKAIQDQQELERLECTMSTGERSNVLITRRLFMKVTRAFMPICLVCVKVSIVECC